MPHHPPSAAENNDDQAAPVLNNGINHSQLANIRLYTNLQATHDQLITTSEQYSKRSRELNHIIEEIDWSDDILLDLQAGSIKAAKQELNKEVEHCSRNRLESP